MDAGSTSQRYRAQPIWRDELHFERERMGGLTSSATMLHKRNQVMKPGKIEDQHIWEQELNRRLEKLEAEQRQLPRRRNAG